MHIHTDVFQEYSWNIVLCDCFFFQTLGQRTKSDQLKAKRKAALKARLDKVKQRNRAKGEIVEEEGDREHQEEEEDARMKEESESARRRQKEEDEKRLAERLSKTAPARPWDIGKGRVPFFIFLFFLGRLCRFLDAEGSSKVLDSKYIKAMFPLDFSFSCHVEIYRDWLLRNSTVRSHLDLYSAAFAKFFYSVVAVGLQQGAVPVALSR